MKKKSIGGVVALLVVAASCGSTAEEAGVDDSVIEEQNEALAVAFSEEAFGPQSPRNIDEVAGTNPIDFDEAPPASEMNLCNIHFHESAEHAGGEFTTFRGNGDGEGYGTGYLFDGELTDEELEPHDAVVGDAGHGDLVPGDTIEIHYVHSTDDITPGPTLGSCLAAEDSSPQLRVEGHVYVLVNDENAADLVELATVEQVDGLHQAVNMPTDLGTPVVYDGSTTGPSYNTSGSPFQVTWSVSPEVLRVNIASVEAWLEANEFEEASAHAVRNLVTNPELLSAIGG